MNNYKTLKDFTKDIMPSDHLGNCSLVLYSKDNNRCTCGDDERWEKDYQKAVCRYEKWLKKYESR